MIEKNRNPAEEEPISLIGDDDAAPVKAKAAPAAEPEAISIVESDELSGSSVKFGASLGVRSGSKAAYKRSLNVAGTGATRCRLFHSRIAVAPLEYMEKQINDWIESDPNIEIKQVGHLVGTLEGKSPEPNIFVLVWY